MPQSVLPIAEWLPDLPDFPGDGAQDIRNVYPRTKNSYGSVGSPIALSSALSARCQGASGFFDNQNFVFFGGVVLYAGDATSLYRLYKSDGYVWQTVSGTSAPYNIDPDDMWEFAFFGNWAIATNINDPVQGDFPSALGVFEDLPGAPPRAKHIAVVKNTFVVLGNTWDALDTFREQRVWWSAAGDQFGWPTPGSIAAAQVQSGFFEIQGNDGRVMAIRAGLSGADAVVFQRLGARRMVYNGPPNIFSFLPIQNARGTPASHSPVTIGGNCYFLGTDGWYVTNGSECVSIGGDKVDRTFFDDLDLNYVNRITGAADPLTNMIWWAYPSVNATGGAPDRLIGYNWQLRRWSIVDLSVEIVTDRMFGLGYTPAELVSILGYTTSTFPAPANSSLWVSGSLQLGLFTTEHKLGYLIGDSLSATVETSEIEVLPGRRTFIRAARPLVDSTAAGNLPSVSIGHRETLQQTVTYTPDVPINALGTCPVRTSGRYIRAVTKTAPGDRWQHISGVEPDIQPQGQR